MEIIPDTYHTENAEKLYSVDKADDNIVDIREMKKELDKKTSSEKPIEDFSEDVLKASTLNHSSENQKQSNDIKVDTNIDTNIDHLPLESRVQALITNQQSNSDKELRDLVSSVSHKRLSSDTRHDRNSAIIGNALEVSHQYEVLTVDEKVSNKLTSVTKILKRIFFVKSKPPVNYIEKQAGLSKQIMELEKRMESAIEEIDTDNQELLGIRNRLEIMLSRISEEIDEIKTVMSEITIEMRGLQQFISDYQSDDGYDIPEVIQAKAKLLNFSHIITRLDRKLINRQTEYTSISMNINNITSDIDGNIDQIDGLSDTRTNLLRLIESASSAYAEDRKLERAIFNSRARDAVNSTLLTFEEKRHKNAERIALQVERPSYDIEVLSKISNLRQEAEKGRENVRVRAAQARQEARNELAQIMSKESIHSTKVEIIDSRAKMLLVKPETKKIENKSS